MQLAPYLFFGGNCSEALDFYAAIFGGSAEILRFGNTPESMPGVDPEGVMHANFAAPDIAFMASDGRPGKTYVGGNISMSIGGSLAEGERIFAALSEGATEIMPLQPMFWGATFGQLTDRFGIEWMFNLAQQT